MKPNWKHAALVATVMTAACSADALLDPSVRPTLPTPAALQVDFSFFHDNAPDAGSDADAWALALATIAEAEAEMELLIVPEALLRAAAAGQGSRDGNVWRWPFSTTVNAEPYEGELRAVVNGNRHEWDLVVTAPDHEPALTNYLWAKAFIPSGGFDGEWFIGDAANASAAVVARTAWLANASGSVDVSFSSSESTSWAVERTPVEHVLTWFLIAAPQARVTWDPDERSGSVMTDDAGTLCWDANLIDVPC
jgi:hypothetical protein